MEAKIVFSLQITQIFTDKKKKELILNIYNRHYKIFCVNGKYGIQVEFRIFYFIALQNEEDYERKESSSA